MKLACSVTKCILMNSANKPAILAFARRSFKNSKMVSTDAK